MMDKLKQRYYWPGYWQSVRDYCRTCVTCCQRKTPAPKAKAPLQPVIVGSPMQLVAVDLLGPLPETSVGNKYILIAGDYFTKWMEVYAIPNQEATTVAQKLVKEMFCRFSPLEALHSDQGRQFQSTLVAQICQLLHIKKTRTTPYHPQSDGLIERFNRTLLNLLSTWMSTLSNNWDDSLKELCMAYNTSVQSTTGYTPFFLMFGREAHLPIDIMFGSTDFGNSQPEPYVSYTL